MIKSNLFIDTGAPTAEREVIPYEPGRVTITFLPPASGSVSWYTEAGGAAGTGIVLVPTSKEVTLQLAIHGEVVRKAWRNNYTAGSSAASWIAAYG